MELVTNTAVIQNASQARCVADIVWLGCCSRMASSMASTKALTKGAGFPITIGVSRPSGVHTTRGCDGRVERDETDRGSYNGSMVAGRTVYRRTIGLRRYQEL